MHVWMCDIRTSVFVTHGKGQCTILVLPASIRRMCAMGSVDLAETRACNADAGRAG